MDDKIRDLIKETSKLKKKEKSLLKEDIRHDKIVDKAKKTLKKKKH